ncbi:MAG TPA: flagellin [Lacunisphaera sp.]|jgi:flagellin
MSSINTNLQAMLAARSLDQNQALLGRSLDRLSSGSKIDDPADDPAGLAVSSKLDAQSLRVNAAMTNVQNAVSYLQTSDDFMSSMNQVLSRMSELSSLAKDVTKSPSDIAVYQKEFTSLQDQLRTTIGGTTTEIGGTADITTPSGSFNGTQLFDSSPGVTISIGQSVGQTITIPSSNLRTGSMLNLIQQDPSGNYTLKLTDANTLSDVSNTVQQLATERATIGGVQSRLNLTAATLQTEGENLSSTISGIRDVDVAQESTQLAKYNILVQAGTSMLAQANQAPASVLKLLDR